MRCRYSVVIGALVLLVAGTPASSQAPVYPDLIPLPVGFGPEGIAVGNGHTFYVGSLTAATLGQILVGDLRDGSFSQLVAPTGRPALGMKHDARSNLLFVANGGSGRGTAYDAATGSQVAFWQFQAPATANINDVVLTRDGAYFTDSLLPFLYRVPLGPGGQPGALADQIPLPANFGVPGSCAVGPPLRGNGIAAAPNGKHLIIMHMSEGRLYRMDTTTYAAVPIALAGGDSLGGGDVCTADGMLLDGNTLYVSQNFVNRIAAIELLPGHFSGVIERYLIEPFASNPATRVPTTLAVFGQSLYAVTAGFAPPAPDFVVRVPN
jgi:sugar lactone lactonase YvrE